MKKFTAHILVTTAALLLTSCGWLGNITGNNLSTSNQNITTNGPTNPFTPSTYSGAQLVVFAASPASIGICWPATVTTANNGLATNVATAVTANINTPTNISAYSNSNCSASAPSVVIPAGSASASLWLKSSVAGSYAISAVDPAGVFAQGNLTLVVDSGNNPNIPIHMALSGAPTVKAGACTAYTASLSSSNGASAAFSSPTTLTLSSSSGDARFYTSASCTTTAVPSVTLNAGVSSVTFYHRNTTAGLVSLHVMANNIYGDLSVLIVADVAFKAVVTGPSTIMTGGCYGYSVVAEDFWNNPSPVPSNLPSPLALTGVGALFSDSACSAAVVSTTIPANNSAGLFYLRSFVPGSATITPSPAGLNGVGMSVAVNQSSGNLPAKLAFDASASSTSAGSCFGPLYLRVQDGSGNTLALSKNANLSTTGNGQFYSDGSCLNDITSVNTGTGFFFSDLKAETLQLNADDGAHILASASKQMNITNSSLYQLVLLGTQTAVSAGDCMQLSVGYADPFLNAVPLASAHTAILKEYGLTTGIFYSDACAHPLPAQSGGSALGFNAGEYQKTVYFKETKAGSVLLEASDGALTPGTYRFSVAAGDPKIAKVTKTPGTITIGECGGPIELTLYDAYDNVTTARVAMTFGMSSAGGSFFADPACGNSTTSVGFGPGSSISQVYFKPSNLGVVTIICTAPPPCGGPTFTIQVNPSNTLQRLAVLGVAPRSLRGPAALFAGNCWEFQVQSENMSGNPVVRPNAVAVSLSEVFASNPSGASTAPKFFASAGCANAVTGISLPVGAAPVSFWYKGTTAGLVDLKASSGSLDSLTYQISVNVGSAASLVFGGPSSSVAGVCSGPFLVSGLDAFGNASPLVNGTALNLSGNGQGGFYAAAGCAGSPITQTIVSSPAIQGSFFFKDNKAENLSLLVAASGLGSANRAFNTGAANGSLISVVGSLSSPATVCSAPITLQVSDAYANTTQVSNARDFNLTQNGTVAFYSDAACTAAITARTIGIGQSSSAPFYFKAAAAQSTTMTVAAVPAGLTGEYLITIGQPACSGTVSVVGNPFNIASLVNAKFPGAIREAPLNTVDTREKICAVFEHPVVQEFDTLNTSDIHQRDGWATPANNTLTYWDKAHNTWVTEKASKTTPRNEWVASIECGCS
jgi:hypothetical protein